MKTSRPKVLLVMLYLNCAYFSHTLYASFQSSTWLQVQCSYRQLWLAFGF